MLRIASGPKRRYVAPVPGSLPQRKPTENALLISLAVVAAAFRFQSHGMPSKPVFNESQTLASIKNYQTGTFATPHGPPLSPLIYSFASSFLEMNFENTIPLSALRILSGSIGIASILLLFLTLRLLRVSTVTAFITSLLFALENAHATASRYALAEPLIVFFVAAAVYNYRKIEYARPLSLTWGVYIALLALSAGLALATSWIALATPVWILVCTAILLWLVLGDLTVSIKTFILQATVKLTVFLAVFSSSYLSVFVLHIYASPNYSMEGLYYSPQFRTTLNKNSVIKKTPAEVAAFSRVTIRHVQTMGGYLHSHNHSWQTGSKQQQVTLYPHLDANNVWEVELRNISGEAHEITSKCSLNNTGIANASSCAVPIRNGDRVRLRHVLTGARLHLHDHPAPVSQKDWQREVSGYGHAGFEGHANDDFIVEIDQEKSKKGIAQEQIIAIDTVFRLRHPLMSCYLFSPETKLPAYAFEQQEVTCAQRGKKPKSYWTVEENFNKFQTTVETRSYEKATLWERVVAVHKRILKLRSLKDYVHESEQDPKYWPFMLQGVSFWKEGNKQVYLLGNAPLWWTSDVLLVAAFVSGVLCLLRFQLGAFSILNEQTATKTHILAETFLGWAIHYGVAALDYRPFLHHYLPALYFQLQIVAHVFEYLREQNEKVGRATMAIVLGGSIAFSLGYKDLIIGHGIDCGWKLWDYVCGP